MKILQRLGGKIAMLLIDIGNALSNEVRLEKPSTTKWIEDTWPTHLDLDIHRKPRSQSGDPKSEYPVLRDIAYNSI